MIQNGLQFENIISFSSVFKSYLKKNIMCTSFDNFFMIQSLTNSLNSFIKKRSLIQSIRERFYDLTFTGKGHPQLKLKAKRVCTRN